jgi:hypothetical protein
VHEYSATDYKRLQVIVYIAFASVALATAIHPLTKNLGGFSWLGDVVSPATSFTVLFLIFDNFAWKILSKFRLCFPDFGGTWNGEILADFNGIKHRSAVIIEIKQTWSRMQVEARTKSARTISVMGSISMDGRELRYEFVSEAKDPGSPIPLHRGIGTLRLVSKRRLEGSYYTQLAQTQNGRIAAVRDLRGRGR